MARKYNAENGMPARQEREPVGDREDAVLLRQLEEKVTETMVLSRELGAWFGKDLPPRPVPLDV